MADSSLDEDRIYARHRRRTGAVLIVGVGAVGGFLAEELARLGMSPIRLVDPDVLDVENLVRHPLGFSSLGQPKASALAERITSEFPVCEARGIVADFLDMPDDVQVQLAREADVVIVAADSVACRQRVNEVCIQAEVPAVYPAVWVDERMHDAEIGEIIWVLPGRHTPCYLCAVRWRQDTGASGTGHGTGADIKVLVLAAVWVVAALLEPEAERSKFIDLERTLMLVHGFMPPSDEAGAFFGGRGYRNVRVRFPPTPCLACGGFEGTGTEQEHGDDDRTPELPGADLPDGLLVTLVTTAGPIRLRMFTRLAPRTVSNFVRLANRRYYDRTIFHRVISAFMIQGGDPTGLGTGGPGYQFNDEIRAELSFDRPYLLAMANTGPNTNGSQFLITVIATPHLNRRHTIFGEVTDVASRSVVDAIANITTDSNDRPIHEVVIERVIVSR